MSDALAATGTSPTGAAALLEDLPRLAAEHRAALGLSLREAAAQIGIGFNSLWRLEYGEGVSLANAIAVLRWLAPPAPHPEESQP